MKTKLLALSKKLKAVSDPAKLFGPDAAAEFKRLSRLCHPDLFILPEDKALAQETFIRLGQLYAAATGTAKPSSPVMLGKWLIQHPIAAGDFCDVYAATGGKSKADGIVKVVRDEADNDLMEREVQALKKLTASKLDPKYQKYISAVMDTFTVEDRRVNVIQPVVEGVPLNQISQMYDLSNFRHIVWMFNRLLTVLGFAHRHDIVHGAVTPDHLLYIPAHHGLVLVDWTASTKMEEGQSIPYKSEAYEHLYPAEVSRKIFGEGTDLYMAAKCMQEVIQPGTMPQEFKPVLDYCLAGSIHSRPDDAWAVQKFWKQTAESVYGPPKFLDLKLAAANS